MHEVQLISFLMYHNHNQVHEHLELSLIWFPKPFLSGLLSLLPILLCQTQACCRVVALSSLLYLFILLLTELTVTSLHMVQGDH